MIRQRPRQHEIDMLTEELDHERAERAKDRAQSDAMVKGLEGDKAELGARVGELTRQRDEAIVDTRLARSGEAYRKAENDRSWDVLREGEALTGGDLDVQIKNLIGACDKAASDCDAMAPVVKRAIELCNELYAGRIDIPFAQANALSEAVTEYKAKLRGPSIEAESILRDVLDALDSQSDPAKQVTAAYKAVRVKNPKWLSRASSLRKTDQ